MIIVHRFTFTHPVQIPGRSPVKEFEPAAPGNVGYTATLVGGGWLFQAPPGTSGISAGGRDELALCGVRDRPIRLAVWVPVDQVVVHYASDDVLRLAADALPTQAPSDALIARRAAPPAVVERDPDPVGESPPVIAPPPTAARRRAPPGAAAAAPPPPSQGWVEE